MRQRLMVTEIPHDTEEPHKLRELIRREVDRLLEDGLIRMQVVATSESEDVGLARGFSTLQTPAQFTAALFALRLTIYNCAKIGGSHEEALKRLEAVDLRAQVLLEEATTQPITT